MSRALELPEREIHVWRRDGASASFVLEVLGAYCGRDLRPGALRRSPLGKPFLDGEALSFSVSRSGGATVVAVSRGVVGVDLERVAPLADLDALAACCLAQAEAENLAALPPDARTRFFYKCWTRKEAFLKALGVGLAVEPRGIDTTRDDGPCHWLEPWSDASFALCVASADRDARTVERCAR
ncbi:MAG: 4'-phosphopantetheinyl transferase superfamily protein [Usitatibacter sp.]